MSSPELVSPTHADPVARASSPFVGGPLGRYARIGGDGFWSPVRVLILLGTLAWMLGALIDVPCMNNSWGSPDVYEHMCYSDIPPLYGARGFAEGYLPYLELQPGGRYLEYPVLTGVFMQVAAWITGAVVTVVPSAGPAITFFVVNAILLFPFFLLKFCVLLHALHKQLRFCTEGTCQLVCSLCKRHRSASVCTL